MMLKFSILLFTFGGKFLGLANQLYSSKFAAIILKQIYLTIFILSR